MSTLLEFDNLHNTRDLGGMKTMDGKTIKEGMLIRSGHLFDLSEADTSKLAEIVGLVVDFRTTGEQEEKPDTQIDGVVFVKLPIVDDLTGGISREEKADRDIFKTFAAKPEAAKKYMCDMYSNFASDYSVSKYAEFVSFLMNNNNKAVLWHCTAGKDRAGIGALIIQEILGVSKQDIIEDYLATNIYLRADIQKLSQMIMKNMASNAMDRSLKYLFGADREYIEAYYKAIEDKFGSYKAFIHEGLGLTDEAILILKEKYLY